jgi:hypothetical protein
MQETYSIEEHIEIVLCMGRKRVVTTDLCKRAVPL